MTPKCAGFSKLAIVFAFLTMAPASYAEWDAVYSADLKAIVNNMTWKGDGWVIYWKDDNTRILKSGNYTFHETWSIKSDGQKICSDGPKRGPRCGVIELEGNVYRSTRTDGPKKGKQFKFAVLDGI